MFPLCCEQAILSWHFQRQAAEVHSTLSPEVPKRAETRVVSFSQRTGGAALHTLTALLSAGVNPTIATPPRSGTAFNCTATTVAGPTTAVLWSPLWWVRSSLGVACRRRCRRARLCLFLREALDEAADAGA